MTYFKSFYLIYDETVTNLICAAFYKMRIRIRNRRKIMGMNVYCSFFFFVILYFIIMKILNKNYYWGVFWRVFISCFP